LHCKQQKHKRKRGGLKILLFILDARSVQLKRSRITLVGFVAYNANLNTQ